MRAFVPATGGLPIFYCPITNSLRIPTLRRATSIHLLVFLHFGQDVVGQAVSTPHASAREARPRVEGGLLTGQACWHWVLSQGPGSARPFCSTWASAPHGLLWLPLRPWLGSNSKHPERQEVEVPVCEGLGPGIGTQTRLLCSFVKHSQVSQSRAEGRQIPPVRG